MQDGIRYGAPALTIDEARALAARVSAVVNERDELRREIHDLRLILGELASLREFLHDDAAGAMAASAQTNGSVHDHGPTNTARVQADDQGEALRNDDAAQADDDLSDTDVEPELDDTTSELDAAQAIDNPAARDRELDDADDAREPPTAERRGETDADDPLYQLTNGERPPADDASSERAKADDAALPAVVKLHTGEALPPADNSELVAETPNAGANDAGETLADGAASEAKTSAVVMDARAQLYTGGRTTGERRGEPDAGASHPGEMPERPAIDSNCLKQTTPDKSDTAGARPAPGSLLARILEFIEKSDRPRRPWQVQKALNLTRLPSAELSRLMAQGFLTRVREGTYGIPERNYGAPVSAEGNQS